MKSSKKDKRKVIDEILRFQEKIIGNEEFKVILSRKSKTLKKVKNRGTSQNQKKTHLCRC
jgi:hypothetical protein